MRTNNALKIGLVCIFVFCVAAPIFGTETIEVGYIEFPPVFSTNAEGKPEGFLIDLADQVLTKAGYKWHATSFPTKRMAKEIVDGGIHLWIGLSTLPEFKDTTLVGESKVAQITLRAYYVGKKSPITKKEDLSGKSILLMRGYSYGGWISYITDPTNNVEHAFADTHEEGFRMLKGERADYFLDYKRPSDKALQTVTVPDLNFSEISSFGAFFVVSKKAPKAEQLLQKIEDAYKSLVKEGKITISE